MKEVNLEGLKMVFEMKLLNNLINLELNLKENSFIEVSIFDLRGQLVYNYSNYYPTGLFSHAIRTEDFVKGKYLLRIAQNGESNIEYINL